MNSLILAAVLLIIQSSVSYCSSDSFSSPSPACPGERVTFHCTVCAPGSSNIVTVWLVSDRLPPCLVQNEVLDDTNTCGPGERFISKSGEPYGAGCYPSTLSTTAEIDLSDIPVVCALAGGNNTVGNGSLSVIGPASISRTVVHLNKMANSTAATVTVHWEAEGENISSYTIIAIPTLPCGGQCVVRQGESGFESRQFNLTVELGVEYSITVRADNCDNSQNGIESETHNFTICVPDTVNIFSIHPLYCRSSQELLRVNIFWDGNVSDSKVRGIEGVVGYVNYKYMLTVGSVSVAVNPSECVGGRCSYMFNATGLSLPPIINISLAAVNDFGSGLASQPLIIFFRNSILNVSLEGGADAASWRVNCSFLSAFRPGSEATCRIDYGTESSYTNLPYSDESTETGGANDSVSIQLQRLNSTTTYYYRVSAIERGNRVITVQGSFTTGILNGHNSVLIVALSSSLLAIFLFAGVLFGILSYHCSKTRKTQTVQLSPRQQSTHSQSQSTKTTEPEYKEVKQLSPQQQSSHDQAQSQSARTTVPQYEEVIPSAGPGVDIELADNVAYTDH